MKIEDRKNAVRFKKVSKIIVENNQSRVILDEISAVVPESSIVTLVGPSGSGKSTLLSLCNLMKSADGGEVLVHGREVSKWDIGQLRRNVGIVFQEAAMIRGTVQENLELAAKLHQFKLEQPGEILSYVGLSPKLLNRNAMELSGGQKQRLSLARTLVNNCSVLLLDEITSALDIALAKEIEELILKINKEKNTTVLWVTHDLQQARRVGDLTWLLIDGKLVEAESTALFFNEPKTDKAKRFLRGEWTGRGQ